VVFASLSALKEYWFIAEMLSKVKELKSMLERIKRYSNWNIWKMAYGILWGIHFVL